MAGVLRVPLLSKLSFVPRREQRRRYSIVSMAYERELEMAVEAVSLACRLCQAVQRKLVAKETLSKADKSPVTVADYGSQALVSWALDKQLKQGSLSLVAEEDSEDLRKPDAAEMLERVKDLVNDALASTSRETKLSSEEVLVAIDRGKSDGGPFGRHWVLDPIDGTKGFLRGEQYAVALGLLDQGEVVVGVLGCPNLPVDGLSANASPVGCLFAASKGGGTRLYSMNGSLQVPRQVRVTSLSDPSLASFCESYESGHSLQDLTANIAKALGVQVPPIRLDSQAKYGVMSRGDAAIYLRFPHKGYREKIWDHAAGSIVIQEAGGVVVDASGKALDFSRGRYLDLDAGIIATNPVLLPKVLEAVQTCVRAASLRGG